MNLVAWLRMDLQENMLLTQYDWQFNANQHPEIETVQPVSQQPTKDTGDRPAHRGASNEQ